jgi:hypothetical protein
MRYATYWSRCWGLVGALGVGLSFLVWSPVNVATVFLTATVCAGILMMMATPGANHRQRPTVRWPRVTSLALVIGAAAVAVGASVAVVPYLALPLILVAVGTSPAVVERLARWRGDQLTGPDRRSPAAPFLVPDPRPTGTGAASGPTDPAGGDADDPGPSGADLVEGYRLAAQQLSDTELCLAWRRSFVKLQSAPTRSEVLRVVAQRQAYLDELDRRRPSALQAWLASGARAAGGPERFLTEHREDGRSDAA